MEQPKKSIVIEQMSPSPTVAVINCPPHAITYVAGSNVKCDCNNNLTEMNSFGNGSYPNGICANGTSPDPNSLACPINISKIQTKDNPKWWCNK
jgi:hypothetical protein